MSPPPQNTDSKIHPPDSFEISTGAARLYRVAQWDDYSHLHRKDFPHRPPISISLQAKVSEESLPGTWGFGLWNDPFSPGIGIKGSGMRLPALPQAAWFFYGSPKNNLSFQSKAAANGWMASVFTSKSVPSILLPLGLLFLPFLTVKSTARWLRRLASSFIQDDFTRLDVDVTAWHAYHLDWLPDQVSFFVDGAVIFTPPLSPQPPLGLVIWIDNQFAAFSADGSVSFGIEANPTAVCLEIQDFEITSNVKA